MSKILVDTIDTRSGTSTLTVGSSNSSAISLAKNVSLGSNVVQSNFLQPSFLAYVGTGQNVSNSTQTLVQFNTELYDTDSDYDTSTYKFTPQTACKYYFYGSFRGGHSDNNCINTSTTFLSTINFYII